MIKGESIDVDTHSSNIDYIAVNRDEMVQINWLIEPHANNLLLIHAILKQSQVSKTSKYIRVVSFVDFMNY